MSRSKYFMLLHTKKVQKKGQKNKFTLLNSKQPMAYLRESSLFSKTADN